MPSLTYAGNRLTTCRRVSKLVSSCVEVSETPPFRSLALRQSRYLSVFSTIGNPLAALKLPACQVSACQQINSISCHRRAPAFASACWCQDVHGDLRKL